VFYKIRRLNLDLRIGLTSRTDVGVGERETKREREREREREEQQHSTSELVPRCTCGSTGYISGLPWDLIINDWYRLCFQGPDSPIFKNYS
jgi:hypothetical protein